MRRAATAFLTAWQGGKDGRAAAATDAPEAAKAALTGYHKDAHLTDLALTRGKRSGATVPFGVKATVSYKGRAKPLAYRSKLTVVRRAEDGEPVVGWRPSVLHPALEDGDRLVAAWPAPRRSRRWTGPAAS